MTLNWVGDFFRDVDAVDISRLADWLADDINLRFGNNPVVTEKDTAVKVLGAFYDSIAGMQHVRENLVGSDDEVAQQATVVYTRLDGGIVPLPVSSYLHRNADGKVDRLWVYIDIHPLYAEVSVH